MDELTFDSEMWEIPTVHISTAQFEADAIEMYEMPHGKIIDMMSAFGPRQMFKMLDLFKLALTDQNKLNTLEILTFNEMTEVVGQWAAKSPVRWLEFGGGKNADEDNDMIDPPLSHEDFADDEDELEIIVSLEDIERLIDKLKEEDASSTEEDDEPF
jgi:hypothetical protein